MNFRDIFVGVFKGSFNKTFSPQLFLEGIQKVCWFIKTHANSHISNY